jgi:deazaflavin-dependent oxidoreductase (nitroreductase family)
MGTELPYGPALTRLLEPLRAGLLQVNRRAAAPMLRRGGGVLLSTPLAGSMLLLVTRGRTSGQRREAPLCYAVLDGQILVMAGFGHSAHWSRNALAHPEVELVLPGAVLAGRARAVEEDGHRVRAMRTLAASMGLAGRATLGDLTTRTDEEVLILARSLPVLAVTPTAVLPGPYDPGGAATRVVLAAWAVAPVVLAALVLRRASR